eukprot:g15794.t1
MQNTSPLSSSVDMQRARVSTQSSWALSTDSHLQGPLVPAENFKRMYKDLITLAKTSNSLQALTQASLGCCTQVGETINQMQSAYAGLWILSIVLLLEEWINKHKCKFFGEDGALVSTSIWRTNEDAGGKTTNKWKFHSNVHVGRTTWNPFFRSLLWLNQFQKTNRVLFMHMCFHLPLSNKTATTEWVIIIERWMSLRLKENQTESNYAKLWIDTRTRVRAAFSKATTKVPADSKVINTLATIYVNTSNSVSASAADMGISAATMEVRTRVGDDRKVQISKIVCGWKNMPWLDQVSAVDYGPDRRSVAAGEILLVELLEEKALGMVMHKGTCGMSEEGLQAYHPAAVQLVPERLEVDYLRLGMNVMPQHYLPLSLQRQEEDIPNAEVVLVRRVKNEEPRHERDKQKREVERDRYNAWNVVDAKELITEMIEVANENPNRLVDATNAEETTSDKFWQGLSLRVFPEGDDNTLRRSCDKYYNSVHMLRNAWKKAEARQQVGVAIMFKNHVQKGGEIVVQTDEKMREMMNNLAELGQHCINLRDETHQEKLSTACSCWTGVGDSYEVPDSSCNSAMFTEVQYVIKQCQAMSRKTPGSQIMTRGSLGHMRGSADPAQSVELLHVSYCPECKQGWTKDSQEQRTQKEKEKIDFKYGCDCMQCGNAACKTWFCFYCMDKIPEKEAQENKAANPHGPHFGKMPEHAQQRLSESRKGVTTPLGWCNRRPWHATITFTMQRTLPTSVSASTIFT